jgi:serine/threonine-protein kinase
VRHTPSQRLEESEEGRAFLQHRMALFGLAGASIGGFFLVFRALFSLIDGQFLHEVVDPSFGFHALAAGSLVVLWLICRTGTRSPRFIRHAEGWALLVVSVGYALMGYFIPLHNRPDMIVYMAGSLGLFARAIYIPSTAWRTALISTDVAVPGLVVSYFQSLGFEPDNWAAIDPGLADISPEKMALGSVLWGAAWWGATIAVCAAASKVIYGLRKEVRDTRKLGQYTLDAKIGEGGMGLVYRAHHAMLRRPTAVKLVPPDKAGEHALARFEREVQLTASLSHPNTVTVFDYGRTPDGIFYYAMEYLDGATLGELVEATGRFDPARVVHILDQTAGALAEAHDVGLIHRDIKPANIMLVEQGGIPDWVKVLDFGLVKEISREVSVSVTRAEVITGTPQYMSPEAIRDPSKVDARSDLYALGAVGYYLLTGEHVFAGASVVEVCSQHLHADPVAPSQRAGVELPAELEALVMQCLAKDPADRPATALALRAAVRAAAVTPVWDEDRARAWWKQHAAEVGAGRAETRTATDGTLEIDLALRQTAAG